MTRPETLHRIPARPWRWVGWLAASQVAVAAVWLWAGWLPGLVAMFASHACFVVPVFLPRSRFYAPVLARLDPARPEVWLTIDDGPSDDTPLLLDLLDAHGARATFFLVGERAAARPALVREIVRRGHGIGNHSQHHPQAWFWLLGPRHMAAEVGQAQAVLAALAGRPPRWFRSVVGMTNPFVAPALRRHGLQRVAWSARGYDGVDCVPEQVVARIARDLRPGAIVLLHEGAAHGHNPQILRAVLGILRKRGLETVVPEQ